MKKEKKDLLLKDLCGRLPYGVKCKVSYNSGVIKDVDATLYSMDKDGFLMFDEIGGDHREFLCKPYLFPLSSMTEEQEIEYDATFETIVYEDGRKDSVMTYKSFDWLNKNHFDYRNLINKNLAIDCTNLEIYK